MPEACPFFRVSPGDGKAYCTIHATRPEICRDFSCWRLLIIDSRGRRAGRVMFRRTLVTDDQLLARLWEDCIESLDDSGEPCWEDTVSGILARAGYTVKE